MAPARKRPHPSRVTILRERTTWKRPRTTRATVQPDDLSPTEAAHVRAALRFLRTCLGGWKALAAAMGIKRETLEQGAMRRSRRPTAGFALRAARVAGVRVESVLTGRWPSRETRRVRRRLRTRN